MKDKNLKSSMCQQLEAALKDRNRSSELGFLLGHNIFMHGGDI